MSHLDGLIDRFLEDHRESDGGYAKVTTEDIRELHEIVQWLIELKCDTDPDGDLPIEFEIVNRRTHERMHYGQVPYRDGETGESIPFLEMMRILQMNLNIAANRLDTEFSVEYHREQQKRYADERS
jgi:hypothetical protein